MYDFYITDIDYSFTVCIFFSTVAKTDAVLHGEIYILENMAKIVA